MRWFLALHTTDNRHDDDKDDSKETFNVPDLTVGANKIQPY